MYLSFLKLIVPISIFLALAIIFLFILIKFKIRKKLPYIKKASLMSEAEKKFFFVLQEILEDKYLIFSKVRMADILDLPKMSNSDFYHYFNKIQSKHVDFLICDKESIKPLFVIELDDSSHLRLDRKTRDDLVDKIFKSCSLSIFHIDSSSYNKKELDLKIKSFTQNN